MSSLKYGVLNIYVYVVNNMIYYYVYIVCMVRLLYVCMCASIHAVRLNEGNKNIIKNKGLPMML